MFVQRHQKSEQIMAGVTMFRLWLAAWWRGEQLRFVERAVANVRVGFIQMFISRLRKSTRLKVRCVSACKNNIFEDKPFDMLQLSS